MNGQAQLQTEVKEDGRILMCVGGHGAVRPITPLDLIRLCVRRERARGTIEISLRPEG
jgi:hypothetical protein